MAIHHDSPSLIPSDFPPALAEDIRQELSRAGASAPVSVHPGRLRAICRRAAGIALRAVHDDAASEEHGSSAIGLLERLATDQHAPSDVAAAAARLRAKREGDDTSTMSPDPLADLARILHYCAGMLSKP
ncbi:MAG: hypothetical protein HY962_02020 [Ignavibacteriae bacterium]|nr:hypothetical protein [Ignavibacteriota bacterium]